MAAKDNKPKKIQEHSKIKVSDEVEEAFISGMEEDGASEDTSEMEEVSAGYFSSIAKLVATFVVILAFVFVFFNFVIKTYQVDGTSMEPTLQHQDRLLLFAFGKSWANLTGSKFIPKRGEIVVVNAPEGIGFGEANLQFIKRVMGLPGDHVVLKDEVLTVYNEEHPDGFNPADNLGLTLSPTSGAVDLIVPEDHIFVCGDNRLPGGSYDSRAPDLGPISVDNIVGTVFFRFLPANKLSTY